MNQVFLVVVLVCAVHLAGTEGARRRTCSTLGATCLSRYELSICASYRTPPTIVRCNRPTPYCSHGACVSSDADYFSRNLTKFTCPDEDGTYPDSDTCHAYRICIGGQDTFYDCKQSDADSTLMYVDATRSCQRWDNSWKWDTFCFVNQCMGSNKYSSLKLKNDESNYGTKQNYYFLCSNGKPTLVQRCPEGQVFDSVEQKCGFSCPLTDPKKDQRRYVDIEGTGTTFIECSYISSTKQKAVRRTCPSGSVFDNAKLECVAEIVEEIEYDPN